MTDWTVERLEALPPDVLVGFTVSGLTARAILRDLDGGPEWIVEDGEWMTSYELIQFADPGSIRVVSVPVDALLSDELEDKLPDLVGSPWDLVGMGVIRAAIAHVTGEQS